MQDDKKLIKDWFEMMVAAGKQIDCDLCDKPAAITIVTSWHHWDVCEGCKDKAIELIKDIISIKKEDK